MTPTADSFAETPILEGLVQVEPATSPGDIVSGTASVGQLAATLKDRAQADRPERTGAPAVSLVLAATVLWSRFHKFDAADPGWPDRDRIVFCDARNAPLHGALLGLSGHAVGRAASGESHQQTVEVAAGPLGQGLGHAVGLALAERLLAARFGRSLVDHRTWVLASHSDLAGGLSHESASLAGSLRLGRLTILWDEPGSEDAAPGDDVLRRFAAYGWAVRRVDGQAPDKIAAALALAMRSARPTLIACRDVSPDAARAPTAHAMEAPDDPDLATAQARTAWAAAGARGSTARRAWLKRLNRHGLRTEFERVTAARLPDGLHEALAGLRASFAASRPAMATRAASQSVLEAVVPRLPELVGGSADLAMPATAPFAAHLQGGASGNPTRRSLPWAIREHGMAAAMNGLALHGGLIPYGGTFVVFTDHMRPALRLAALMRQRVIHVLTRDGGDRAEDGSEDSPSHQAIEQLAGLRAVPNLFVFRPADAIETAECWELALGRGDGPSLLALSRQPVPSLRPPGPAGENRAARGGYVLADTEGTRQATLIATGPEVATAMAAREVLRNEGLRVAVVSLPCWELFERLTEAERESVLGAAPRIGVEAAGAFGWARWLGSDGVFVGFDQPAPEARTSEARTLAWSAQGRPTAADVISAVRQRLSAA